MGKKIHKDVSLTAALAPYFRIFVANWNTDVEGRPTTPTVEILYEESDDEGTAFSLWFKSRAWAYAFGADWGIALVQHINPMIAQGVKPVEEGPDHA
ncbi:hypothetical protein Q5H93_12320 [Hymenobacter sp. ASUV-10]|uniref:Uncharacterized protein n=1 Tax=Hymenobacter aranciens TaxID=3063996 RepID=A0ABT9BB74_9BACT|nr:hypothetical protein [Hymenobacter sp. ASUV-10]MDO7875520.1 hypothetical protein [Hymenobacter sp. ASUV-10]